MSIGSILAAVAPSLEILIAARVVAGFGSGSIPTLSATAIARRFDGPARARAIGAVVGGVGLGLALGPLFGGIALELVGWRGPVALGIVSAPAVFLLAREESIPDPSARLDLVGALVIGVGVVALMFGLNRLPVPGITGPTIAALALVAIVVPIVARRSHRPDAFIPRRIITDPSFTRVVAVGAVGMSVFLGSLVLVPTVAARSYGFDGIALGLILLPLAVAGAITSVQSARVQIRIGRRTTTIASLSSLSIGAVLVGLTGGDPPPVLMAALLIPFGVGFGLLHPPLVNEVTVAFEGADRTLALGLYNMASFLGGAAGAAKTTAIVHRGFELPFVGGETVAGYATAELLLALGPIAAVAILVGRRRRDG